MANPGRPRRWLPAPWRPPRHTAAPRDRRPPGSAWQRRPVVRRRRGLLAHQRADPSTSSDPGTTASRNTGSPPMASSTRAASMPAARNGTGQVEATGEHVGKQQPGIQLSGVWLPARQHRGRRTLPSCPAGRTGRGQSRSLRRTPPRTGRPPRHAADTPAVRAPAAAVPAGMPKAARSARRRCLTWPGRCMTGGHQRPTRRGHRTRFRTPAAPEAPA